MIHTSSLFFLLSHVRDHQSTSIVMNLRKKKHRVNSHFANAQIQINIGNRGECRSNTMRNNSFTDQIPIQIIHNHILGESNVSLL